MKIFSWNMSLLKDLLGSGRHASYSAMRQAGRVKESKSDDQRT